MFEFLYLQQAETYLESKISYKEKTVLLLRWLYPDAALSELLGVKQE